MGAVGHYLEQEGIPSTQISLIREHTEIIRPPRALWVPFVLGRPLGAPRDADFQRKVLLAALALFDASAGPVLADFAQDAPQCASEVEPQADACPVNFARPRVAAPGEYALARALDEEIGQLLPWHDLAVKRRGGSNVGLSGRTPAQAAAYVVSFLGAQPPVTDGGPLPLVQRLKYACDDLRAFYEEAASAQPGALTTGALQRWFYFGTVAGAVLLQIKEFCLRSEDQALRALGKLTLIPRAVAVDAQRRAHQG